MAHLSDAQLDTIRRLLADRETELQGEVLAANEEAAERPAAIGTEVGDAIDVGDERFRAGMAHVDKQRDQEELMAIDAARGRLDDGSYGECIDCGKDIPVERLKAQPAALRCVPCQEIYEKTHPAAPLFSV
ncbi:MAG: TraR/DksA family transcriptional regulator [Caldimonas sp.]